MAEIFVKGMSCEHCRQSVAAAVEKVEGVRDVAVSLADGLVSWQGAGDEETVARVRQAVTAIGFDVE